LLYTDNRLLFFDTHHIDSLDRVSLTMNPPEKRGPCLAGEKKWELGSCRACNVIYYDGSYRLYYTASPKGGPRALAFAVSQDGINWERPKLGAVTFGGSKANNLCDFGGVTDYGETCVFVDPHGPPEQRVKCTCHHPWQGLWVMVSPDGIHWKRGHEGLLLHRGTDNNMTVFWDETIGKYRVYLRGGDKSRSIMGWAGSRSVVYTETEDITEPLQIDEFAPDPHFYGYERPGPGGKPVRPMPGIYKELPTVMRMDESDPPEADMYQAAAVHYAPNAYVAFPTLYYHYPPPPEGFRNDGWLDLQFAASRDGRLWRRDFRGSYVRLDMTGGQAWKSMHMVIGAVPTERSLYQYYVGGKRSHGEGRTDKDPNASKVRHWEPGDPIAFRLEQRLDGFVSADSDYTGGSLLTRPFRLNAKQLAVNIDTSASGDAHAALIDESGLEIKGLGLEESDRIQCNDTKHVLTWRGKSDLAKLKGKTVRLLLKSRNAKLFAVYPETPSAPCFGK
jgi:hypothetical protein